MINFTGPTVKSKALIATAVAVPLVMAGLAPQAALASTGNASHSKMVADLESQGVLLDPSFDPATAHVASEVAGKAGGARTGCVDRAAVALTHWQQSGQGCSVIGTSASTKVYFAWYLHRGSASAVSVLARGFNRDRKPTFYECGNGTGRNKAIPWGNVASAKYIKMLANKGWGGIQWS